MLTELTPAHEFDLEVSFVVKKKQLGQIVERCINVHGVSIASHVLDSIKAQGYKYSTVSGTTVAVCDALIPEKKKEYLQKQKRKLMKSHITITTALLLTRSVPQQ